MLFVDHFMRREKVGLYDAEAVSTAEMEHYVRALGRPGTLRSSSRYYRTLPADRFDNGIWGRTPLPMPTR